MSKIKILQVNSNFFFKKYSKIKLYTGFKVSLKNFENSVKKCKFL